VNQKRAAGEELREAVIDASVSRLRPIVMTSLAFILGVVPLVLAAGAGAEMRRALGIAVFSGMLGVTLFGILLTPVFYYLVERLAGTGKPARAPAQPVKHVHDEPKPIQPQTDSPTESP